jgi:hypothetical protein
MSGEAPARKCVRFGCLLCVTVMRKNRGTSSRLAPIMSQNVGSPTMERQQ